MNAQQKSQNRKTLCVHWLEKVHDITFGGGSFDKYEPWACECTYLMQNNELEKRRLVLH